MMHKPKFYKKKIYRDARGNLGEIYKKHEFKTKFNFILQTTSKKNVFRGFHFQLKYQQTKLLYLIKGSLIDIVINLRKNSKDFGKIYKFKMEEGSSLFIPKGFAHGYFAKGKENILIYIMDNYQNKKYESGINLYDHKFKFNFKKGKIIMSKKDKKLQSFKDFVYRYGGLK